ncbi:hypothetical protein CWE22_07965 [Pseudidiomarina aestuarii]|uniref:Uncharacterized protein n=1 Tax=Pseudidiomarina aestuarii TaxID=624146 RepID=A0A7Z7EUS5_9GAMM|nr:hypothetical protein [Pseudidiomarina aestuarii]RUO42069.1 hypothetical protein CWE22_07965 [Pseudidiomarina aestuarii]
MKPLNHIIYLVVIAALAVFAWFQSSSKDTNEPITQAAMSDAVEGAPVAELSPEVAEYIEQLEFEVNGLRRALQKEIAAREEREQMEREVNPGSSTSSTVMSAPSGISDGARPFLEARDVHAQFKDEEVDPVWSVEHEQRLIDLMITDEGLRKFSVGNVECKTDTCRLTFVDDIEDPSVFTRELSRAVFQANWDDQRFVTIMQQVEGEEDSLNIYLKRME